MPKKLKPYTCTYRFEGRPIGFTLEAGSFEETSARLRAIGMTAVVEGEQITEVDLFPSAGLFSNLARLLRRLAGVERQND